MAINDLLLLVMLFSNSFLFCLKHHQEKQPFYLTEEERRTLVAEGLPVPTGLPLTKVCTKAQVFW